MITFQGKIGSEEWNKFIEFIKVFDNYDIYYNIYPRTIGKTHCYILAGYEISDGNKTIDVLSSGGKIDSKEWNERIKFFGPLNGSDIECKIGSKDDVIISSEEKCSATLTTNAPRYQFVDFNSLRGDGYGIKYK